VIGNNDIVAGRADRRAPDMAVAHGRRRLVAAGIAGGCALALFGLFYAYVQLSRTFPTNSDGAAQALQAWQMFHGNPLLRGWYVVDVSYYTTELPQYMLVELVHGLDADVVHVAAGMTYVLVLLGAALLATGRGTGWGAALGAGIAAGIMLVPQGGIGVDVLLSSPDHTGTAVPIMLAWLILDRARLRWWVALGVALLLGWVAVADELVILVAIVPLVLVVAIRLGHALARDRASGWRRVLTAQRLELALAAGAVVAAVAARLALRLISAAGGFTSSPPAAQVAPLHHILMHNVPVVAHGLLLLFGADFLDFPMSRFLVLHLAGVLLVVAGIAVTVWRFLADRDLVAQLLLAGIVVNLGVFLVSTGVAGVPTIREVDVVATFGAALAGRQLGPRIARPLTAGSRRLSRFAAAGLVAVLGLVGAGYTVGLVREITPQVPPTREQRLADWLTAHHLYDGLSGYWVANVVTLASGGEVRIGLVGTSSRGTSRVLVPGFWEEDSAWDDPAANTADFVVLYPATAYLPGFTDRSAVTATFGQPARTYAVDGYQVMVWPHVNLLVRLEPGSG
jgi:hypothetical protein